MQTYYLPLVIKYRLESESQKPIKEGKVGSIEAIKTFGISDTESKLVFDPYEIQKCDIMINQFFK